MNLGKVAGAAQALAINAVSVYGVFFADWPVGTGIALYWAENVLRGLLILILLGVRRKRPTSVFLLLTFLFNAVHAVFLLVILGFVIPRVAPAERFEGGSFRQGLIAIAILLAIEYLVRMMAREDDGSDAYVRRVVVIHLTIVLGKFGIVLFDRATVLFRSFAALKTVMDVVSQWRTSRAAVS
ncbi:MAG: DUF6498-containing protein [Acidobacteriota bacterium]